MDYSSLASYYNNLFTIQVTLIGIIIAALFVFIQLTYSTFTFKQIMYLVTDKFFISTIILSLFTLSGIGIASFSLSVNSHNFIPNYNLGTRSFFINETIAALAMVLTLSSIVLFIFVAIKNIKYLNSRDIVMLIINKIQIDEFKYFLTNKYGIELPYINKFRFNVVISNPVKTDEKIENWGISEEEYQKNIAKEKELTNQKEAYLIKIRKYKENPIESIFELLVKTFDEKNLNTTIEIITRLLEKIDLLIDEKYLKKSPDDWDMDSGILKSLIIYLREKVDDLLFSYPSLDYKRYRRPVISLIEEVANRLIQRRLVVDVKPLFDLIERYTDVYITESPEEFKHEIGFYEKNAKYILENYSQEIKDNVHEFDDLLNEIFRKVGWLTERLIQKKELEFGTRMPNLTYASQIDAIRSLYAEVSHIYGHENKNLYPLIFFDAINVSIHALYDIKKRDQKGVSQILEEWIFDIYSIGTDHAKEGNTSTAWISAINLQEILQIALLKKDHEIQERIIDYLIGIFFECKLSINDTESRSPIPTIKKVLIENIRNFKRVIDQSVSDRYIRHDYKEDFNTQKIRLIELGDLLDTDFGLRLKNAEEK